MRIGAVANRRRWTTRTASMPMSTERESGSVHMRTAALLIVAMGVGGERTWVIG
jgi:hypothetical protein